MIVVRMSLKEKVGHMPGVENKTTTLKCRNCFKHNYFLGISNNLIRLNSLQVINISKPKFARTENVGLNHFFLLTLTVLKCAEALNGKVEKTQKISETKTTINSYGTRSNPGGAEP